MEQALAWLRNKMAEKDTLDAVNAELTYNVIMDIQKKRQTLGVLYNRVSNQNKEIQRKREMYKRWPGLDPMGLYASDIVEGPGEEN